MRNPIIDGGVFLHGDSLQSYCLAILVPNRTIVTEFAKSKGIDVSDFENLCKNKEVRLFVLNAIREEGKKGGLHSFE